MLVMVIVKIGYAKSSKSSYEWLVRQPPLKHILYYLDDVKLPEIMISF